MTTGGGRIEQNAVAASGLDYILSKQGADGAWTDWMLPPGPAPHWTTAYVGRCLSRLPGPHPPGLKRALGKAADWLHSHRLSTGVWGYNDRVEPDADTTSLAVLFLTSLGRAPGQDAIAFLNRAQRPDGGFATFLPDGLTGAWGQSHAEITAIALLALRSQPGGIDPRRAEQGLAWLRRHRRADGTWAAYWWATPFLATDLARSCLTAFGSGTSAGFSLSRPLPDDSLQAAHVLAMAPVTSPDRKALTERLVKAQNPDGSWTGCAALRIPPRDCAAPWNEPDIHPVHADPHRIFTTATVVSALASASADPN